MGKTVVIFVVVLLLSLVSSFEQLEHSLSVPNEVAFDRSVNCIVNHPELPVLLPSSFSSSNHYALSFIDNCTAAAFPSLPTTTHNDRAESTEFFFDHLTNTHNVRNLRTDILLTAAIRSINKGNYNYSFSLRRLASELVIMMKEPFLLSPLATAGGESQHSSSSSLPLKNTSLYRYIMVSSVPLASSSPVSSNNITYTYRTKVLNITSLPVVVPYERRYFHTENDFINLTVSDTPLSIHTLPYALTNHSIISYDYPLLSSFPNTSTSSSSLLSTLMMNTDYYRIMGDYEQSENTLRDITSLLTLCVSSASIRTSDKYYNGTRTSTLSLTSSPYVAVPLSSSSAEFLPQLCSDVYQSSFGSRSSSSSSNSFSPSFVTTPSISSCLSLWLLLQQRLLSSDRQSVIGKLHWFNTYTYADRSVSRSEPNGSICSFTDLTKILTFLRIYEQNNYTASEEYYRTNIVSHELALIYKLNTNEDTNRTNPTPSSSSVRTTLPDTSTVHRMMDTVALIVNSTTTIDSSVIFTVASALYGEGILLASIGNYTEAFKLQRFVRNLLVYHHLPSSSRIMDHSLLLIRTFIALGENLAGLSQYHRALRYFDNAYEASNGFFGNNHILTVTINSLIAIHTENHYLGQLRYLCSGTGTGIPISDTTTTQKKKRNSSKSSRVCLEKIHERAANYTLPLYTRALHQWLQLSPRMRKYNNDWHQFSQQCSLAYFRTRYEPTATYLESSIFRLLSTRHQLSRYMNDTYYDTDGKDYENTNTLVPSGTMGNIYSAFLTILGETARNQNIKTMASSVCLEAISISTAELAFLVNSTKGFTEFINGVVGTNLPVLPSSSSALVTVIPSVPPNTTVGSTVNTVTSNHTFSSSTVSTATAQEEEVMWSINEDYFVSFAVMAEILLRNASSITALRSIESINLRLKRSSSSSILPPPVFSLHLSTFALHQLQERLMDVVVSYLNVETAYLSWYMNITDNGSNKKIAELPSTMEILETVARLHKLSIYTLYAVPDIIFDPRINTAYYKWYKKAERFQQLLQRYGQQHPSLSFTTSTAGAMATSSSSSVTGTNGKTPVSEASNVIHADDSLNENHTGSSKTNQWKWLLYAFRYLFSGSDPLTSSPPVQQSWMGSLSTSTSLPPPVTTATPVVSKASAPTPSSPAAAAPASLSNKASSIVAPSPPPFDPFAYTYDYYGEDGKGYFTSTEKARNAVNYQRVLYGAIQMQRYLLSLSPIPTEFRTATETTINNLREKAIPRITEYFVRYGISMYGCQFSNNEEGNSLAGTNNNPQQHHISGMLKCKTEPLPDVPNAFVKFFRYQGLEYPESNEIFTPEGTQYFLQLLINTVIYDKQNIPWDIIIATQANELVGKAYGKIGLPIISARKK